MFKVFDKRGSAWSLEFIIKMIIAIVCIFLILVVINSLFGIVQARHQLNQAKVSLNGIVDLANGLMNSNHLRAEYVFNSPRMKDDYILVFDPDKRQVCVLTDKRVIYACEDLGYDFVHIYFGLKEDGKRLVFKDGENIQEHASLKQVPFKIIALKRDSEPNKIYFTHLYAGDKFESQRFPYDILRN